MPNIIQYVLPSRNKQLKKLLHFYREVCPKYDENGKLKQEMILVVYVLDIRPIFVLADRFHSNAIRNDLVSVIPTISRTSYLRLLPATPQRIYSRRNPSFPPKISKDSELLEPLIPICRSCLEHRHSYVRKNAVFAVYTIYREFDHLIPDAPELMPDLPGGWIGRNVQGAMRSCSWHIVLCLKLSNGYWAFMIWFLVWMSCCRWASLRLYDWRL